MIVADGYKDLSVKMAKAVVKKQAPAVKNADNNFMGDHQFHWDDSDYINAITGIEVNQETYSKGSQYGAAGQIVTVYSSNNSKLNKGSIANTMVIHATGYEDATVTFYITKDGKATLEQPQELKTAPKYSVAPDQEKTKYLITFEGQDKDNYWKAVTKVTVNGRQTSVNPKGGVSGVLQITNSDLQNGSNTVLIEATGYQNLTVTIEKQAAQQGNPAPKLDKSHW